MSKLQLDQLSHEELVGIYQETESQEAFESLFTRCHRELLKFLMGKHLSLDDAEDLLQDYFVNDFERSIKSYDLQKQRKFINYLRHILLFRFFSFYKKQKRRSDLQEFSLDEALPHDHYKTSKLVDESAEQRRFVSLVKGEIKEFFREILFSMENENHRNAIILKLCLPLKLSAEEISDLLDCSQSSYSTWLYRGTLELREKAKDAKDLIPCSLDEIFIYAREESFALKPETLKEIDDRKVRESLDLFVFSKLDRPEIARKLNLSEEKVQLLLRKGIFELLTLLKQRELLFRHGGEMYIEKDDVMQFIEALDETSASITKRKSVTTGDDELDRLLTTVYSLFHEGSNDLSLTGKPQTGSRDQFLKRIKERNLSMDAVREQYGLNMSEINLLMSGTETIPEDTLHKLKDLLESPKEEIRDIDEIIEADFQSMNQDILKHYYEIKVRTE
ncbi:MAG TPA: sigma-70 family RNA polymerase sigma factor [Spirochaetes bacterium]|nr:sigma-70 family RNA polymerase sigma factor [Spirochaetota bacterium]